MELFPATDEDAWSLIQEVIDGCDYYILILAGKYGSAGPEGIGYTEMEFDFATSISKPILVFLHENPESLPAANIEKSEVMQTKLSIFREKAKAKHCKFWISPEDLGGKVSRSLVQLRKRHPSPGWVPGRFAASDTMLRELQELRAKVAQLELEANLETASSNPETENLAQGNDSVDFYPKLKHSSDDKAKETKIRCTWDTLLSYFGPNMSSECTDKEMMDRIRLAFYHAIPKSVRDHNPLLSIILPYVLEDKIQVQFQALGYIAPGTKSAQ